MTPRFRHLSQLAASLGGSNDSSQPKWEDAPDWQKNSALAGVRFHFENPDAGASASHDNWREDKVNDGWVWGPVKDPEKKQHPCMVAFDELPIQQRLKDYLFKSIVHALAYRHLPVEYRPQMLLGPKREFSRASDNKRKHHA